MILKCPTSYRWPACRPDKIKLERRTPRPTRLIHQRHLSEVTDERTDELAAWSHQQHGRSIGWVGKNSTMCTIEERDGCLYLLSQKRQRNNIGNISSDIDSQYML